MNWHRWLATLFVAVALAGCAQGTAGQAGAPNTAHSPENSPTTPEHGRGNLGGGGDSM
jgi:hypothetical protein